MTAWQAVLAALAALVLLLFVLPVAVFQWAKMWHLGKAAARRYWRRERRNHPSPNREEYVDGDEQA